MYKGKFDAKSRGQQAPADTLENILKERDAAIAQRAARQADRARRASAPAPQRTGRQPNRPVSRSYPDKKPARTEIEKIQPPKKNGPRIGGVIFYSVYFLFIFVFFIGVVGVLNWLNGWLKAYEVAQPTVKSQEVFNELFNNPDWAKLYRLSNVPDSDFEGAEEYVAYIEEKVGNQPLNFVETSAGLSQGLTQYKKYIVRLGTEKLATFTLEGKGQSVIDIPDWKLSAVDLVIKRNQSIRIKKLEDHVAYVNGVPLDDSYTIQIGSTKADEYLPTGTPKIRTSIQELDGLMAPPQLVVYDQTGANRVDVLYNPESGMYEEQNSAIVITDEERNAVFGALEAYAGYMINVNGSRAALAKYFDGSSKIYNSILKTEWRQSDNGHEFRDKTIHSYTKHSDNLFSVRASLVLHANTKDGSTTDFDVKQSMFFTKKNGNWVCYDMTNEDISEVVGQVRLTFRDASGNIQSSEFYPTDATTLTAPMVDTPAGKVFSGWSRIEKGADNVSTWTIVFRPDETGKITPTQALEPMDLYPLFENA